MAHIGGSPGHQLFTPGSRQTAEARKAAPQSPLEQQRKTRGPRTPEQSMAQLTGKLAEAKKLKRMALRKARRRRRRGKKKRGSR